MIKKSVFTIAMVGCFAAATLFSVNNAEAKKIVDPVAKRGSTYTLTQTSECTSGQKHKCEGQGTLCNLTLGWDCVVL